MALKLSFVYSLRALGVQALVFIQLESSFLSNYYIRNALELFVAETIVFVEREDDLSHAGSHVAQF